MSLVGHFLLLTGLLFELIGAYLIGHEYLQFRFRDFLKEPFIAAWYGVIGKKYPYSYFVILKGSPDAEKITKGFFFVSGGIFLQMIGTLPLLVSTFFSGQPH